MFDLIWHQNLNIEEIMSNVNDWELIINKIAAFWKQKIKCSDRAFFKKKIDKIS